MSYEVRVINGAPLGALITVFGGDEPQFRKFCPFGTVFVSQKVGTDGLPLGDITISTIDGTVLATCNGENASVEGFDHEALIETGDPLGTDALFVGMIYAFGSNSKAVSDESVLDAVGQTSETFDARGFSKVSVSFTAFVEDESLGVAIETSVDGSTWATWPSHVYGGSGRFGLECPNANYLRLKFYQETAPNGLSTVTDVAWFAS